MPGSLSGLYNSPHLDFGLAFEDGGAGDQDLGAGLDHERSGLGRDAAVDFDGDVGHLFEVSDLLDHLWDEGLAPKAGVYAHDVYVVQVWEGPLYEFGRGRRVQGHAGLAAPGPDQLERAV